MSGTLFPTPPVDPNTLTARQRAVYDLLQRERDGITAAQAGAAAHGVLGCRACDAGYCEWASTTGNQILHTLHHHGLAKRNKHHIWRATPQADDHGELPEGF